MVCKDNAAEKAGKGATRYPEGPHHRLAAGSATIC
jgi:hypothetical protein